MNTEKQPNANLKELDLPEQEVNANSETSETIATQVDQPEVAAKQPENPEEVILNPEQELQDVSSAMQTNSARIAAIMQDIENEKGKLNKIRESLGLPPSPELSVEASAKQQELEALEREQAQLEEQKENALAEKDLEKVLQLLGALPKNELQIIITTGKNSEGKELKTPDGKTISPDVAKKLAEAAEGGATKLTKAILGAVLGIVKGILQGIFGGGEGRAAESK